MPDEPTPQQGALPLVVRAMLNHAAKLQNFYRDEAVKAEVNLAAAADMIAALEAAHARGIDEHAAALTDRDLGHSQHVARLEADIERLHRTIRDQAKQSLENETLAHGHARAARQELADHVEGKKPGIPALVETAELAPTGGAVNAATSEL